jgi:VWFA-related protein
MRRSAGRIGVAAALGLVGAAALVGLGVAAQTPQQQPTFRQGVQFVFVDVYPTRDGRLVDGLTRGDFQVFEDGKPQTIDTFEFIRFAPNAPDEARVDPNTGEDGDRLAADPHNRVFVVYLDTYHVTVEGSRAARLPLTRFLDRVIGPSDLFGVMTPDMPVRQLVFGRKVLSLEDILTRYWYWGRADLPPPQSPAVRVISPPCGDAGEVRQGRDGLDRTFSSLEGLMLKLAGMRDERKTVLLFSGGWTLCGPMSAGLPGRDMSPEARRLRELASMDFRQRYRDLLDLARRSNVTFESVDPQGLGTLDCSLDSGPCQTMSGLEGRSDTLRTLSNDTNGVAIVSTNNLEPGLRRIADDLSAYYLLGYYSTNSAFDGKYRRIDVKVQQPGVKVIARRGYLAPTEPPTAPPGAAAPSPDQSIDNALARLSTLDVSRDLATYAVREPGEVDVAVEMPGDWMAGAPSDGGATVSVRLLSAAGGDAGIGRARIEPGQRSALVAIPLSGEGPGPWTARVTVDAAGQSLRDGVEVATSTSHLIGPPIVYRADAPPVSPLHPAAEFAFSRLERIHVDWPEVGPVDRRQARLLDRTGRPLSIGVPVAERTEGGRSVVSVDLNLAPLFPGDYLIEVTVGRDAQSERRLLAIRIR